ncbi:MAG: argininosuccinate lyase [Bacillota bacterium]
MRKMWGGRFSSEGGRKAEGFTSSLSFDRVLWRYDLVGSVAHAKMLARQRIITQEDADLIIRGLDEIGKELEDGSFPFRPDLEDIHLNIEGRLAEKIGRVAGRLHTARSRNDQVALDMHMYIREETSITASLLMQLEWALLQLAKDHIGVVMPGYTHLQRAQPVLFSHHVMAYFWMFARDLDRLKDCLSRVDMMPLGASALSGTGFPIDPGYVAAELGFGRLYENSMDAVSDRDYILEFLFCLSLIMVHTSRLAEELVLWSSQEFGFIEMDDAYSTGSSIMPQKKNPDVAELGRGKSGRVFGSLLGLLTVVKGLPLTYNSDMQEDKEGTFNAVNTVQSCLRVFAGMLSTLKVKEEAMAQAAGGGFLLATELADYLARKGVPFREAHHAVGRLVGDCIASGRSLGDLDAQELSRYHPQFDLDALGVINPVAAVNSRTSPMGTAEVRLREQMETAAKTLDDQEVFWLHKSGASEENMV